MRASHNKEAQINKRFIQSAQLILKADLFLFFLSAEEKDEQPLELIHWNFAPQSFPHFF